MLMLFIPNFIPFIRLFNLLWNWKMVVPCLFLGVLFERKGSLLITSVYRKRIFITTSCKINLISTMVHRALMIWSPCRFDHELENIHRVFVATLILLVSLNALLSIRLNDLKNGVKGFDPTLCPVYLKLPWLVGKNQTLAQTDGLLHHVFLLTGYLLFCGLIRCLFLLWKMVCPIFKSVSSYINLNVSAKPNT